MHFSFLFFSLMATSGDGDDHIFAGAK